MKTYGKQKPIRKFIQDIKDKFTISTAMKIRCGQVGLKPYKTAVRTKNILIAIPVTIIAILIPAPPITAMGLIFFVRYGLQ